MGLYVQPPRTLYHSFLFFGYSFVMTRRWVVIPVDSSLTLTVLYKTRVSSHYTDSSLLDLSKVHFQTKVLCIWNLSHSATIESASLVFIVLFNSFSPGRTRHDLEHLVLIVLFNLVVGAGSAFERLPFPHHWLGTVDRSVNSSSIFSTTYCITSDQPFETSLGSSSWVVPPISRFSLRSLRFLRFLTPFWSWHLVYATFTPTTENWCDGHT